MTEARETTERAVVGCLLIDSRAIDSLVEAGGSASWFIETKCASAAREILKRYEEGKVASDLLAINETGVVGIQWLEDCIELVPTKAHTEHYISTLKGHADKDSLTALGRAVDRIVRVCTPETVQDARASIEAAVNDALCEGSTKTETVKEAAHAMIDRLTTKGSETTLLDWPLPFITSQVGRISNELIWICAQPSVGKTAFILQHMLVLAKQGKKVALASLESDVQSVAGRLMSSSASMDTYSLRQGTATESEIEKARKAADSLSENLLVTSGSMTVEMAYAWGKAMVRKGAKMLIFDNSRHVIVNGAGGRVDEMSVMSKRFKQLRDETGIPVVVLHHTVLNEHTGAEKETWSSDIRRDCDMLIFLQVGEDTVYPSGENGSGAWQVKFKVEKHREGRKGSPISMRFYKETQTFGRWVQGDTYRKSDPELTTEIFDI